MDKSKGWLQKRLPSKVRGEYMRNQLNPKEHHSSLLLYNNLISSTANGGPIHGLIGQFDHGN